MTRWHEKVIVVVSDVFNFLKEGRVSPPGLERWWAAEVKPDIKPTPMRRECRTVNYQSLSLCWKAMALTLWALLEAGLLVVNAICVLHEQRFLAKGKKDKVHMIRPGRAKIMTKPLSLELNCFFFSLKVTILFTSHSLPWLAMWT